MYKFLGLLLVAGISISAFQVATCSAVEDKPAVKTDTPLDDAAAKKAFEENYEAGSVAASEKKWEVAQKRLGDGLKALGERPHANKSTATVLLNKAQKAIYKDDALNTANELKRLKQWAEAEEAYRLVINVTGETESLKKSIEVCRENLESENEGLKAAHDLFKARKWQESIDAYNKAAETLGTLRPIREGVNDAKLYIEADALMKKAPSLLAKKDWEEAFNAYNRVRQILGETDEVKKGIAAAQAGYAEEHKPAAPVEKPK
jgi:hypothetical protein